MTRQLLKGIRVLDFTDFLAGPYCGMYLADMGADVIKVENLTTGGNFVRNARPLEKNSGLSMYFQNLNRNKRGVAINLKTEDGKKLFSELVKSADVLLENNRPGVMGRLGFSYEECKKLNPRLVYASISGFGQYGPNANRPGYDLIGQAMGGSMSITGWPGSEPTRAGMAIGDLFGGLNAGFAICASLYNREKTGVGNHIDVALVDSIFSGMEAKMMQYVYTGVSPVKTGNKYITSAPYDSFKAKDDYFVIASGTDKHFEKLSAAMGMPELAQDPLYCDTESRKKNADSLKEIIEKWTADKTVSEVCKIIDEAGIPVAPIYNCEQAANDKNIVEVREINTNGNLISTNKGGHANGAFDLGSGYKCYASTDVSGSPLETYDAAKSSTYKYLCVTTKTLETGGGSTHQHVWDEAWHDTGDYHHAHQCTICKAYDTTTQEPHNVTGHRDNHDGSHSNICGSCGYSAKVSHSYTWAPNANDNEKHIGTCVCGNVVERYHNFVGDVCSDCGYDKSTGTTCEHVWTTEWTIDTVDNEYHWHKCIKCNAITDKKPHAYTIVTDSGTNHIRECECKVFYVEDHISSDWIIDTPATATTAGSMHKECTVCKHKMQTEVIPATGEIEPPTPDNPGTIVIIRPAEEEKPAQQPNPSTGANDLVGLAVAAAVAAALGSAALLRKHD